MKNNLFPVLFFYLIALLVFSFPLLAQQKPAYDPAKSFYDYSRQMNAYYKQTNDKNGYKQWKRLEWYFSTRLGKDGKPVNMQQMKQAALQAGAALKAGIVNQQELVSGSWSQVGPLSVTQTNQGIGRVNRLAFHPTDVNILYAATAGGGLWKTTNGGSTWNSLTDGLPNSNTSGVAVHKTNPNILYILTGDGDGRPGYPGVSLEKHSTGVFKSTDAGITWNTTGLQWGETQQVASFHLVMHPSNFNILLAATSIGIFRTSNAGATWTNLLPGEMVYDIEFMPNNGQVVYAAAQGGKFFRSQDGGISWTLLYDNSDFYAGRVSISVTPDNSSIVYMLISNDDGNTFNGLYQSTDMGDSWSLKASNLPNVFDNTGVSLTSKQQNYNHSLAVSPFNSDIIITGAIRIFRSTNGGSTLNFINNTGSANYHVDVHQLDYNPTGSALYAATDGGVYKSINDGISWTPVNGNLAITQYYRISVSTASSTYILGGSQDNGTHLRNTNSSAFASVLGSDGMDNAISISTPSYMYASTQNGSFYRSTNTGSSFSFFLNTDTLQSSYGITASNFWVTPIAVSTTTANTIFAGYYPLIKGVFSSGSWSYTNIGFRPGLPVTDVSGRSFVKVAPSNENIIYAGDNDYSFGEYNNAKMMFRTSDGGQNWTRLYPGAVDSLLFTDLAINPDNPNEIWVTMGNFSAGEKVYRSSNGGTTWTNITGSLPNIPVNCIVYDDNNGSPDDALYIGTDIGVFYRDNTLGDWIPFSNGLPVIEVTDLEINESAGFLRAGTYGRGVWQTSVYDGVCAANPIFTIHPPSEPGFFTASGTITSTAVISGAGAHIQYKSGQRTTLNPGFKIDATGGAKFISIIGPCPGGGVPPGYNRSSFNGLTGYLK